MLSVLLGQLKQRNDWLVGYYYSHIETFAVNASYAQDDWVRFGNRPHTASSDFKGHEVRLGYALSKNINVMARLYLVDAITTVQVARRNGPVACSPQPSCLVRGLASRRPDQMMPKAGA